jgi:hypothetical protein
MNYKSQVLGDEPRQANPSAFAQLKLLTPQAILAVVIVVAVLLRIVAALFQGDSVLAYPGVYDQVSYDGLARRVLAGHGFSFGELYWPATRANEPTAHWSFLYTLYLTAVYALFGVHPLVARLIQGVAAGILHCWLAWRLGRRLFGPAAGLVTAGLSAVYIYFFFYAGSLVTETFYITAILWTFDVALRIIDAANEYATVPAKPRLRWQLWAELGLALSVTVLLRQLFMLFIPFLYGWLWWNLHLTKQALLKEAAAPEPAGRWAPHWRGFVLATVIIGLLILPWTVRNYRVFGVLVPLNTNSGYVLFWGNHPIHGTQFMDILPNNTPGYYGLIPPELLQLNEAELDQALLRQGIGFILADRVRFILLSLSRIPPYFKFWPSADSSLLSNISRVGSFGLCLPFIVHGLYLSIRVLRRPRHAQQGAILTLLYLFILVYTGIHLLTWTLIRYRLPVDAILLPFAAYSIVSLYTTLRSPLPRIGPAPA